MNKTQNVRGRQRLINATLKSLGQRGYHASSLRTIAETAGLSAGLVKHHFNSKDELMLEAYRFFRGKRMDALLENANKAGADPVTRLKAITRWIFLIDSARREALRIWTGFVELVISNEKAAAIHLESRDKFVREIRSCITGIYAARGERLSPNDAQRLAMGISAMIDGAWYDCCLSPSMMTAREALKISLDMIGVRIGVSFQAGADDGSK